MLDFEEANRLAKQKLLEAERALNNHVYGRDCDYEIVKKLTKAVHSARCEALDLLSTLWPESD